ncbi:hypothetical protein Microterr_10470 [Microbacterium terricola]|uniref:DUF3040 domain-containing protein n=2 Tax=Microbacterium terricola TaxID=344163 RepID=A0ABM8DXM0_9MICO|nr:hypothetical protein Microterr_10470 [Microbacterium terricola]
MHNDADVVSAARNGRTLSYRNIVYGTILVLLGLGALVIGVSTQLVVVGVLGFVAMLGGVVLAVTPTRGTPVVPTDKPHRAPASPQPSASFMDRMNDRWDRRNEDR